MKKLLKDLYEDFNVPVNDGSYFELGGFTAVLIFTVLGIILVNELIK